MKRLLSFMLCASVFFVFGCNTTPDPVLSVSPESLAFTADGGAQTVQVKANNPWTASVSGSGISVKPSSGDGDATVTVTAVATSSTNPITGTVNFRSEGLSASVSVTQEERKVIQVGDVMTIPAEGGSFAVDVQYNTDIEVEVEASAKSWIEFVAVRALQSGKLEFKFTENEGTDPRQGKVTVKDKNGKVSPITLTFVQEEKKVIAVGDVMEIPAEGGTFAVDVQYNTNVVVEVESAAKYWITFVAVRALQSGKLEFRFAENGSTDPRQGKVTVKDKNGKVKPITLTFVQAEKKVIAVGDVMEIPSVGGTFSVDVQYNTDVVVEVESAAQSWIHFVAVRALTSGKLEFSFDANPNPDVRTGKVTVKDRNGKVAPITLTFSQKEKKVIAVGDIMEIPEEGGIFAVDIQYNTDVVVEVESAAQSWINFVTVRALTSGKLEFWFKDNYNNSVQRTGTVTVKDRNGIVAPVTLTFVQKEDTKTNKVREVLMQFYTALDGPNWKKNKGWGTAANLNDWEGVDYYRRDDILQLLINDFGLKGEIPECIGELTSLMMFSISNEPGLTGTLPESFGNLVNLNSLYLYNTSISGLPESIGNLVNMDYLYLSTPLSGLPESIGNLSNLKQIYIQQTSITHLPDVFGNLKNLQGVYIQKNELMTGPLPESLGSSDKLEELCLNYNSFTGSIPASWARLINILKVGDNCLTGKISSLFNDREEFRSFLKKHNLWQKAGYGFDISDMDIPGFDQWIDDPVAGPDGSLFTFNDVIRKSKYTVYVIWAPWCPFSRTLMPALKEYYETYRQDGLEVIATCQVGGVDENGAGHMLDDREGYLKEVVEKGYDEFYSFYWPDYGNSYLKSTPNAEVYDHNGNVVFSSFEPYPDPARNRFSKTASTDLIPFLEGLFGPATPPDPYESQDYSSDGQVLTLQKASVGKGINIVFMGDAYTDKDMGSGGVYETAMRQAMEQFFAVEPYKTFRNRFNVYAVKVVSKNGRIGSGYTTALGTYFGSGTYVDGNDDKCYEYALKVPGIDTRDNLLVSVLVNSNHNAGTAILSRGDQSAVARVPSFGNDPDAFGSTLQHEAGGHGFAFLADEYATNSGTPPQSHINEYNDLYDKYGWYSNVDFTSDPSKIRWSAFLNDSRYNGQVGIYEGAALYTNGAWRPTANSIMRDNYGGFNAPSRWAIYKQIMKRSGEEYSWEKFLEYDAVNRTTGANAPKKSPKKSSDRHNEPGAPPVIKP